MRAFAIAQRGTGVNMARILGTGIDNNLSGTSGADTIIGYDGNDAVAGFGGADNLYGGPGDDVLFGGRGADRLWGGPGFDTFRYTSFSDSRAGTGYGIDIVRDFDSTSDANGIDVVDLTALGTATLQPSYKVSFTGLQAVFTYNASADVTTLSYFDGLSAPVFQLSFTGHVTYDSFAFPGILPTPIHVYGTAGDDDLSGGPGDFINGYTGSDLIFADAAAHVFAGRGDDLIVLGVSLPRSSWDDFTGAIHGGDGSDLLILEIGDYDLTLDATQGKLFSPIGDVLFTFDGIESYQTGDVTTLIGSDRAEQFTAGADHSFTLYNVSVSANGGDDRIYTGEGDDRIMGGAGDDTIDGYVGVDTAVYGGNRADYIITVPDDYVTDPFFATATVQQIGGGGDGTDILTNVEFLAFADGTYEMATGQFTPFDSIL